MRKIGTAIQNNIQKLRHETGLTQPQFAEKIEKMSGRAFSRTRLSHIETQKHQPNLELALVICKALGRSPEDVFYLDFNKQ